MTRLTPAREAEIRGWTDQFEVRMVSREDVAVVLAELDAVRVEREAIHTRLSVLTGIGSPDGSGELDQVELRFEYAKGVEADLAAAQARLAEVTQELDAKNSSPK